MATHADGGFAERQAAKIMIRNARQATASPDAEGHARCGQGYEAREFVQACQGPGRDPHVAQSTSGRRSAVPDAIAASDAMTLSQRKRKLLCDVFIEHLYPRHHSARRAGFDR